MGEKRSIKINCPRLVFRIANSGVLKSGATSPLSLLAFSEGQRATGPTTAVQTSPFQVRFPEKKCTIWGNRNMTKVTPLRAALWGKSTFPHLAKGAARCWGPRQQRCCLQPAARQCPKLQLLVSSSRPGPAGRFGSSFQLSRYCVISRSC